MEKTTQMKTLAFILIVLFLIGPALTFAQEGRRVFPVKIWVSTKEERTALVDLGLAIEGIYDDYVVSYVTQTQLEDLRRQGYGLEVMAHALDFPVEDADYHNYEEVVIELNRIASTHINIAQMVNIGQSVEGRNIYALKVSDNVTTDEDEPEVLYVSLHHAREHLSTEMGLYLAHYLADNYGSLAGPTNLVNERELWIIPMLNPDGSEYDVSGGYYYWWRKNRRLVSLDVYGVDLNRNYDYHWGQTGSSGDPSVETYRGPSPFSELETQAMRDFMNAHPDLRTLISFHTYGELIMYPYAYTYEDVPSDMSQNDHDVFVAMAQAMAATNGYTPQQTSDLYLVSGELTDWAYGRHGIFGFTFEMYPGSSDAGWQPFYPPDEIIPAQTARNREACEYLAAVADNPYKIIGQGGDAIQPTVAISNPTPGLTLDGQAEILAHAEDEVGVTLVAFTIDGQTIGLDTTAPYTATWDAGSALTGCHTLEVEAYDRGHNVGRASIAVGAHEPCCIIYFPMVVKD